MKEDKKDYLWLGLGLLALAIVMAMSLFKLI